MFILKLKVELGVADDWYELEKKQAKEQIVTWFDSVGLIGRENTEMGEGSRRELTRAMNNLLQGLEMDMDRGRRYQENKLWKEVDVPYSLRNALERFTKDDLVNIRRNLRLVGISHLNKKQLVDVLLQKIPEHFNDHLYLLDEERYKIMKKTIKRQGVLPIGDSLSLDNLEDYFGYGYIFPAIYKGERVFILPIELQEQFIKTDGPDLQKVMKRNTEWIKLTYGMLFYYGVLANSKLEELIQKYIKVDVDFDEFHRVLSLASEYYEDVVSVQAGYVNIDVFDLSELIDAQMERDNIDYYPFTKKQLFAASEPDYVEKTPQARLLMEFILEHYEITREEVEEVIYVLVMMINNGEDFSQMMTYLQKKFEFPSLEFLNIITEIMMHFHNNTRMWMLKGHTPNEIRSEFEEAPKPKEQNTNVIDFASRKKVGRNDPCPCGSGKKYKKCCGK